MPTAILFAGQGVQKVGMAKDLAARYGEVSRLLDEAEDAGRLRHLVWTIPSVVAALHPDDVNGWHSARTVTVLRTATKAYAEMEEAAR